MINIENKLFFDNTNNSWSSFNIFSLNSNLLLTSLFSLTRLNKASILANNSSIVNLSTSK